jgi:hypothetical protein
VTNKQIELMDAKRADEWRSTPSRHGQGRPRAQLLEKKIEQSVVSTDNSIKTAEAAAAAKSQPKEPA